MTDWLFLIGVLLVAIGVGAIHWFLAPIFVGALMMLIAYQVARHSSAPTTPVRTPHPPRHPDITTN